MLQILVGHIVALIVQVEINKKFKGQSIHILGIFLGHI